MTMLNEFASEIVGMFMADGRLSAAVLALIAVVALLIDTGLTPLLGGGVLLVGCLVLLVESVRRHSRASE
jgi:hypothetical protein